MGKMFELTFLKDKVQLADRHLTLLFFNEMQIKTKSQLVKLNFKKASVSKIIEQLEFLYSTLRKNTV